VIGELLVGAEPHDEGDPSARAGGAMHAKTDPAPPPAPERPSAAGRPAFEQRASEPPQAAERAAAERPASGRPAVRWAILSLLVAIALAVALIPWERYVRDSSNDDEDVDPPVGLGAAPEGEDLALPADVAVAAHEGLLEIFSDERAIIAVDRSVHGEGPLLRLSLPPGRHEVRARWVNDELVRPVLVREGRRTRLVLNKP
jgi:hypothetical protein